MDNNHIIQPDSFLLAEFKKITPQPFDLAFGETCKMSGKYFRATVEIVNQNNEFNGDNEIPESHFIRAFKKAKRLSDDYKDGSDFIFISIMTIMTEEIRDPFVIQEELRMLDRCILLESFEQELEYLERTIDEKDFRLIDMSLNNLDDLYSELFAELIYTSEISTDIVIIDKMKEIGSRYLNKRPEYVILCKRFSPFPRPLLSDPKAEEIIIKDPDDGRINPIVFWPIFSAGISFLLYEAAIWYHRLFS